MCKIWLSQRKEVSSPSEPYKRPKNITPGENIKAFRRLNELYARTDQVGFMTTQRVDGRLILPESVKVLKMAGTKAAATTPTTDPDEQPGG